jgi:hypothetical protein
MSDLYFLHGLRDFLYITPLISCVCHVWHIQYSQLRLYKDDREPSNTFLAYHNLTLSIHVHDAFFPLVYTYIWKLERYIRNSFVQWKLRYDNIFFAVRPAIDYVTTLLVISALTYGWYTISLKIFNFQHNLNVQILKSKTSQFVTNDLE